MVLTWCLLVFTLCLLADCDVGYKREGSDCVKCPVGTYRGSVDDPQVCTPCPEGTTTRGPGSQKCEGLTTCCFKKMPDTSRFCVATDTPVLNFW